MATATLTSKHQITIPREVRTGLNLNEGDQVEFEAERSGVFVVRKKTRIQTSDGAAAKFVKNRKRLSVSKIKEAAKAGAIKSFSR